MTDLKDLSEEKRGKLVKNLKEEIENEKKMHMLLEQKVSEITEKKEKLKFSQKISDAIGNFVGSWKFIILLGLFLGFWIILNVHFLMRKTFDPYPVLLLNLILSCVAAIQAPLIMMSQKRKRDIDRQQKENDYKVNLKTEIVMEDIHYKLDELLEKQEEIVERIIYLEGRKPDPEQRKYKFMKDIFEKDKKVGE
ncbi:DUF1003 domain-containing protein [Pseudoleptotrichia goodfellowii]|uniref:DUF1003 domain-containing protein n=1 Tax=Pseudoleptotrichia goodfellowii F0264 TaxID=596323 RepID=D0GIR2_9FUSO|nr:DUF1003 domain-containing protein [Pseudoleptotrichia goodfellowii]EEY36019.1 hypothetical protein HMPREF0554_0408 [Pseudoleptotrichia goodfellowii F0264]